MLIAWAKKTKHIVGSVAAQIDNEEEENNYSEFTAEIFQIPIAACEPTL